MNTKEIWKSIPGYEDFYEVSSHGNVRGLMFLTCYGKYSHRKTPRTIRQETTRDGYKRVCLSKDGIQRHFAVHRLVASAFIPNPDNLPEVNHKDENPANNHLENLEWCSASYNSNYGTLPARIAKRQTNSPAHSKQVLQMDMQGNVVATYPSTKEAERQTGVKHDNIQRCCRKPETRTAGGYKWRYGDEN